MDKTQTPKSSLTKHLLIIIVMLGLSIALWLYVQSTKVSPAPTEETKDVDLPINTEPTPTPSGSEVIKLQVKEKPLPSNNGTPITQSELDQFKTENLKFPSVFVQSTKPWVATYNRKYVLVDPWKDVYGSPAAAIEEILISWDNPSQMDALEDKYNNLSRRQKKKFTSFEHFVLNEAVYVAKDMENKIKEPSFFS